MSKIFILCSILLIISSEVMGQESTNSPKNEHLFPIRDQQNKYGFIDIKGRIVIGPQFEEVGEFSEGLMVDDFPSYDFEKQEDLIERRLYDLESVGLAGARKDDKWGFIDRRGKFVIKPRWVTVAPFSEGLAAVIERREMAANSIDGDIFCGYINKRGVYVIKPRRLRSCGNFSDGLAKVAVSIDDPDFDINKRATVGYLDKTGSWAIRPQFIEGAEFKDGFALVDWNIGGFGFVVDKQGKRLNAKEDCRWRHQFSEGLAIVSSGVYGEDNYKTYFINENCEKAITLPRDVYADSDFSNGLAAVYKIKPGSEWMTAKDNCGPLELKTRAFGYIDRTGKMVIPLQYEAAEPFSDGFAVVHKKTGDDGFYINQKGEEVFKEKLGVATFKNGLAAHFPYLQANPKLRPIGGYMNTQGKYVWVDPASKNYLSEDWFKKNYVGSQKFD